jgi:hypothetical protein
MILIVVVVNSGVPQDIKEASLTSYYTHAAS